MAADVLHFGLPPVRFHLVLGRPRNSFILDLVLIQRMGDGNGHDRAPGFPARLGQSGLRWALSTVYARHSVAAREAWARRRISRYLCENWDGLRIFRPRGHASGPGRLRGDGRPR